MNTKSSIYQSEHVASHVLDNMLDNLDLYFPNEHCNPLRFRQLYEKLVDLNLSLVRKIQTNRPTLRSYTTKQYGTHVNGNPDQCTAQVQGYTYELRYCVISNKDGAIETKRMTKQEVIDQYGQLVFDNYFGNLCEKGDHVRTNNLGHSFEIFAMRFPVRKSFEHGLGEVTHNAPPLAPATEANASALPQPVTREDVENEVLDCMLDLMRENQLFCGNEVKAEAFEQLYRNLTDLSIEIGQTALANPVAVHAQVQVHGVKATQEQYERQAVYQLVQVDRNGNRTTEKLDEQQVAQLVSSHKQTELLNQIRHGGAFKLEHHDSTYWIISTPAQFEAPAQQQEQRMTHRASHEHALSLNN